MRKFAIAAMLATTSLLVSCSKEDAQEKYVLSSTMSTATWKGYQRSGDYNEGYIDVESKFLVVKQGKIVSGSFLMPLSSLKNSNLPTEVLKNQLITHLQSGDFFNMILHPDLAYRITAVKPYNGGAANGIPGANFMIEGDFTMLGKSLPVTFPAKIDIGNDELDVKAIMTIDRTKWGMTYGAQDTLSDQHYIKPEVDIYLQLHGTKN